MTPTQLKAQIPAKHELKMLQDYISNVNSKTRAKHELRNLACHHELHNLLPGLLVGNTN